MTAPMRVGVTGAAGQVGSRVLRHLHAAGIAVVGAVRNPLGAALCDAVAPGCEVRVGSLTPGGGEAHVLDDCDVIVNCALESSGGIPRHAYSRNRALVDGLLRARALKWLVHFSTVAVYGELIEPGVDADRLRRHPHPDSEYGRSKLDVERHARRGARARGVGCTIVRLGHVYGGGVPRSREIVEFARDPRFRLPFGGRHPSNAVHADTVGASIVALLRGGVGEDVVSLAERAHTWRDVFDWHTGCLGLPPVLSMDDDESTARRDAMRRASIPREAAAWARGLPIKALVRSPATFDLALRVLVHTPDGITKKLSDVNRRVGARAQIAQAAGTGAPPIPPLYFSEGMPAPFCDVPPPASGPGSLVERARQLQAWFDLWRAPRMHAAMAAVRADVRMSPSGTRGRL